MTPPQMGEKLRGFGGKVGKAFDDGVRATYEVVSKLERDVQKGTGVAGQTAKVLAEGKKKVSEIHGRIKAQGGYCAVLEKKVESFEQCIDKAGVKVDEYVGRVNARIERDFYTDCKFDAVKVDKILDDKFGCVKVYGEKAVRALGRLAKAGVDAVVKDYRAYVPGKEELDNKYFGIGTSYQGVLLRDNYEGCLAFHGAAERVIPNGRAYRNQILKDIKASASENLAELQEFYASSKKDRVAELKSKLATRYFASEKK